MIHSPTEEELPNGGCSTSGIMDSGSASGWQEAVDVAMMRRQAEWDRQLESVDKQQAEVLSMHWHLMREQMLALSRDVVLVQVGLRELRDGSRNALVEVEKHFREFDARLADEHSFGANLHETFERLLEHVRTEVHSEIKLRTVRDEEVANRLQGLSDADECHDRSNAECERQLRMLKVDVQTVADMVQDPGKEIALLKEDIRREVSARASSEEGLRASLQSLQDSVVQEKQERQRAHEELALGISEVVDKDKESTDAAIRQIKSALVGLQKEVYEHSDSLRAVSVRVGDVLVESSMQAKEMQSSIGAELATLHSRHAELQSSLQSFASQASQEAAERASVAEELRRSASTFELQVKALLGEQAEATRRMRAEVEAALVEAASLEERQRTAAQEVMASALQGHKSALDSRVDALQRQLREAEQRSSEALLAKAEVWEGSNSKKLLELERFIRDACDGMQGRLSEEREMRASADLLAEERSEHLERFLLDFRELVLHRAPPSRSKQTSMMHSQQRSSGTTTPLHASSAYRVASCSGSASQSPPSRVSCAAAFGIPPPLPTNLAERFGNSPPHGRVSSHTVPRPQNGRCNSAPL